MSHLFRQWWLQSNPLLLLQSEHRLLSAVVSHPFEKLPRVDVNNSSKMNNSLNDPHFNEIHGGINLVEFRARNTLKKTLPTVVLAHGFGSGLGFFYRNIDGILGSRKVSRVVLIDWLGMGGSSRPSCWESPIRSKYLSLLTSSESNDDHSKSSTFASKISFCNSKFTPSRAVDFFLDPLDRLLRNRDIFQHGEPLWLVGHSLGGYLVARYAMRIHQSAMDGVEPNLTKLILASPVGFQPLPSQNERLQPHQVNFPLRLVDALWSSNFTPQAIVRVMGASRGKSAVKRALRGRIPHLNDRPVSMGDQQPMNDDNDFRVESQSELDLLADYLYHVTVGKASGECAMNSLLEPVATGGMGAGVYAREPLGGGEMTKLLLGARNSNSPMKSIKVLFGDNDWMKFHEPAARAEMESIRSHCGISANVHTIPSAGHHLYLDNVDSFVRHILNE